MLNFIIGYVFGMLATFFILAFFMGAYSNEHEHRQTYFSERSVFLLQDYKEIKATDYMSRSREVVNKNFECVGSNFSGDTFPTINLFAGMFCYRTDKKTLYQLDVNLSTWHEVYKFTSDNKTYIANAYHADSADKAKYDESGKELASYLSDITFSDGVLFKTNTKGKKTVVLKKMSAATQTKAGESGLVPPAQAGQQACLLTGAGEWINVIDLIYPVGSIYMSTNQINPSKLFGGAWEALEQGRVLLSQGTNYPAGSKGGEETITLTEDNMPKHTHRASVERTTLRGSFIAANQVGWDDGQTTGCFTKSGKWAGGCGHKSDGREVVNFNADHYHDITVQPAGYSKPHTNMQPYLSVYMWKRIL